MQGDREGAGQVALDGERRGGVAQVRDGAEGERRGERVDASADLSAACPRLAAWAALLQRVRAVPRDRLQAPPARLLRGRAAQLCADSVLVSSRRGIDADEPAAAEALALIRDGLGRGLSPEQLSARNGGPVDLSPSTIYRWVSAGYDGMTNMELRRKVGYRPRRHAPAARPRGTRPAGRMPRSSPSGRTRAPRPGRWTPSGARGLRLPAHAAAPPQQAPARAAAGGEDRRVRRGRPGGRPGGPRRRRDAPRVPRRAHRQRPRVLRRGRDRRAHRRGAGRDEAVLRPRRSDQKGACERNHVEIRKLLPKGRGLRFDRLAPADLALAMSHVNSEPRGALGFATPARAFRAMLGGDAAALLEAYGIEDVPIDELDLTPGLIERARAERGDAPLS